MTSSVSYPWLLDWRNWFEVWLFFSTDFTVSTSHFLSALFPDWPAIDSFISENKTAVQHDWLWLCLYVMVNYHYHALNVYTHTLCVYVCVCVCAHVCVHMCVCLHAYMHVCVRACARMSSILVYIMLKHCNCVPFVLIFCLCVYFVCVCMCFSSARGRTCVHVCEYVCVCCWDIVLLSVRKLVWWLWLHYSENYHYFFCPCPILASQLQRKGFAECSIDWYKWTWICM